LTTVLGDFPPNLPMAVVVQQHLGGQGSQLVPILERRTEHEIAWVEDGARLSLGRVLVTRPRQRLEILPDGTSAVGPEELGSVTGRSTHCSPHWRTRTDRARWPSC
jgi:chemotaxis response regulator CheB